MPEQYVDNGLYKSEYNPKLKSKNEIKIKWISKISISGAPNAHPAKPHKISTCNLPAIYFNRNFWKNTWNFEKYRHKMTDFWKNPLKSFFSGFIIRVDFHLSFEAKVGLRHCADLKRQGVWALRLGRAKGEVGILRAIPTGLLSKCEAWAEAWA